MQCETSDCMLIMALNRYTMRGHNVARVHIACEACRRVGRQDTHGVMANLGVTVAIALFAASLSHASPSLLL